MCTTLYSAAGHGLYPQLTRPSLLLREWVRLARIVYHHARDKKYQALSLFSGKSLIMRLAKQTQIVNIHNTLGGEFRT